MQALADIIAGPIRRPASGEATLEATLEATISEDWLQGKTTFGGLQSALAVRAMRAVAGDAIALRALQATFVAAVGPGPVQAVAQVLRQGRAVTHVQCRLESEGRTAAIFVGLFGTGRMSRATLALASPPVSRGREEVAESTFKPGVMPPFIQHYSICWAEGQRPFSASPPRPLAHWARLRDEVSAAMPAAARAAFNEAALVAIADLPPTPLLSMLEARAPAASLTWLLELLTDPRTVDPGGWLQFRTEARAAGDGYGSQTGCIWDESGTGLAVSHQTVGVFG